MKTVWAVVAAGVLFASGCTTSEEAMADLVFRGGAVWTGDPAAPPATAVAVKDGRIVAVGTDAEVEELVGV